jgi:hypothetical protein
LSVIPFLAVRIKRFHLMFAITIQGFT